MVDGALKLRVPRVLTEHQVTMQRNMLIEYMNWGMKSSTACWCDASRCEYKSVSVLYSLCRSVPQ